MITAIFDISLIDVLKAGGVGAVVAFIVAGLVMLFSRRYVAKDREQSELQRQIVTHFMEFIERKDRQANENTQQFLTTLQALQAEISKTSEMMTRFSDWMRLQNEVLRKQNLKIESYEVFLLEIKKRLDDVLELLKMLNNEPD